jgi:hypothetical protein
MGIAYDFTVKKAGFSTSIEYGFASRTGEVTNVGKHKYDNSYVGFQLGFKF